MSMMFSFFSKKMVLIRIHIFPKDNLSLTFFLAFPLWVISLFRRNVASM